MRMAVEFIVDHFRAAEALMCIMGWLAVYAFGSSLGLLGPSTGRPTSSRPFPHVCQRCTDLCFAVSERTVPGVNKARSPGP